MCENELNSLWGAEFNTSDEDKTKKIITKIKKPKEVKVVTTEKLISSKSVPIEDKLKAIDEEVHKILGSYEKDTVCIKDYNTFKTYIDKAIENGVIAIDTETNNSLNTFDCKIMGLCLYTPGQKNAYIPVNHVNRLTNEKLSYQITEDQIREQMQRIMDNNVFEIYHNATFDIEVIKTTCGIRLHADWDTLVGAQLIDENELKGLKTQYKLHINPEQDKYDIEHLFKGLPYEIFDPELFSLYAATDSYMTYKLYEYQKEIFRKPENKEVYELFQNIEIPVIEAIVDMELNGVEVDTEYASKMSGIYHAKSDEIQTRIDAELEVLKPIIDKWRTTPEANAHPPAKNKSGLGKSKSEQLLDPPDLGSPTQMAVLLYDVLKAPSISKKSPRGTGADILEALAPKFKICSLLLEKRDVDILINTFIDKIPEFVQKDGRVHARFNQCGTQTGRFSSSDPNLTQIPSHDKTIRMMFKPQKGYAIVGSDFSGQEIRILASLSKDKKLIKNYEDKKDPYATIASICFKTDYEDCLEFDPRNGGQLNPEGKARRSRGKTLLLGLNYGMGVKTLAERIDEPVKRAQEIIDEYYAGFTGIRDYTNQSQDMLKKYGFITDAWGRRRHIPDGQLSEFEFILNNNTDFSFNPLIGSTKHADTKGNALILKYKDKISHAKWKSEKDAIIEQAKNDGLEIKYNGGYISRALRQCLNARIQGSAASMTKLAMSFVHSDPLINELGGKLLVCIHDEMFLEAPAENSSKVATRLKELMVKAAQTKCENVPWKCDSYEVIDGWYEDEAQGEIQKDFTKLLKSVSKSEAIQKVKEKFSMFDDKSIELVCEDTYLIGRDSLKYGPNYYQK